ncbi:MAG TPA: DUF4190 domain-containing protein [Mycobacteriales bacterium]|nr:DUF4190 domain-containing protein [Mycobacteriales bacterium]
MSEEPQAPPPWQMPPPAPWQPPPPPPYAAPPGWQPQPYGYPQPTNTNGFAIAALVCSLVGILLAFIGPVGGIVFGIVGLRQARERGEGGRGLAIAGIVIGAVVLLLDIVGVVSLATDHTGGGGSGGVSV